MSGMIATPEQYTKAMLRALRFLSPLTASLLMLTLAACSPHPSAGGWHALDGSMRFQRLEIRYDGSADFYTHAEDKTAAWRCFWSAINSLESSLKCVDAGNADNEKYYSFSAQPDQKLGNLKLDGKTLGRYGWQPPAERPE